MHRVCIFLLLVLAAGCGKNEQAHERPAEAPAERAALSDTGTAGRFVTWLLNGRPEDMPPNTVERGDLEFLRTFFQELDGTRMTGRLDFSSDTSVYLISSHNIITLPGGSGWLLVIMQGGVPSRADLYTLPESPDLLAMLLRVRTLLADIRASSSPAHRASARDELRGLLADSTFAALPAPGGREEAGRSGLETALRSLPATPDAFTPVHAVHRLNGVVTDLDVSDGTRDIRLRVSLRITPSGWRLLDVRAGG